MLNKHRSEVTNPHRKGEIVNQWVKDYLTEYAESPFSLRPTSTGVSTVREGLRITPFRGCGSCTVSSSPKRTGQSDEQRDMIL